MSENGEEETQQMKEVIKVSDMTKEQEEEVIKISRDALTLFNVDKDIAAYIKKELDLKFFPKWHCIVGQNFGSYVSHETGSFVYFYLGDFAILLFKAG